MKRRNETLSVFLFKGSVLRRKGRKNLGGEEVTLMTNDLMTAVSHTRDSPLCVVGGFAVLGFHDVNRNFDLHVFSRAGPVAAATNLADKSAHHSAHSFPDFCHTR